MDGRGHIAKSLTWLAPWRSRPRARSRTMSYAQAGLRPATASSGPLGGRRLRRWSIWLFNLRLPSGLGMAASTVFLLATLAYGVVVGDHISAIVGSFKDARDAAANAGGFRIAAVAMTGERHISREEILSAAGVTGTTSLLFFDVEDARDRLKANPWIADATVLKLYPDRLQIDIKERAAFALWQQAGRVSVVADDGTVLEPYVNPRLIRLPLVVGLGAAARSKEILTLLERYPDLRDQVRAAILIGERRWNLRLRNGLDIRLPEIDVEPALLTLASLDKDKKLLSRDIISVDLRLSDRVTVQLSEAAAAARAEALKDKKPAKKGAPA
jgi:cell division protein FtsQ